MVSRYVIGGHYFVILKITIKILKYKKRIRPNGLMPPMCQA